MPAATETLRQARPRPLPSLRRVWRHALGWGLFVLVFAAAALAFDPSLLLADVLTPVAAETAMALPLAYASVAWVRSAGSLARGAAGLALLVVGWAMLAHQAQRAMDPDVHPLETLAEALMFASFSVLAHAAWTAHRTRQRLLEMQALREQAEQRLFSSQLAPHVLFNLLNVVYAAALTQPEKVAPQVRELSTLVDYLQAASGRDFSRAAEEWGFIQAHARMVQQRVGALAAFELEFDAEPDQPVPALLLVTLFENAVKHGTDAEGRLQVHVVLRQQADGLELRVGNSMPPAAPEPAGLGLGLDLVRQRLGHLYGERHRLDVLRRAGWHEVRLLTW